VLLGEQSIEGVFARSVRIGSRYQPPVSTLLEPTQVKVDNDTSDRFTILEVFANDRQGLLYVITRTIFELGLSVSVAKIATSLDQVLDVFYVTDQAGQKVADATRVAYIQDYLARSIEAFERCSPVTTVGVA
jgi:[protein-PII] uridylyltransferase